MSWLFIREGVPMLLIDRERVMSTVPLVLANAAMTRIILYETGRVVMHWGILRDSAAPHSGSAAQRYSFSPEQDREAWWFGEMILALAKGDLSFHQRQTGRHDQAWTFA